MPESDDSPSIYLRGRIWWHRITVAGVEHRKSLRTADEGIALRRAREHRATLIAHAHFGEHRPTWEEAFLAWSEEVAPQLGPKTAQRYTVSLGQIEGHLRGLFVDQIDKKLVKAIVAGRRAQKVAIATIKRDLSALSSVLSFAEDHFDLDIGNPARARAEKMKERREPIVLPAPADIERVITRAPGNLAHMIRAAWLTGCRQDELVTVERRGIDWTREQMTVIGKRRKLRVVPLTPDAVAALRRVPASLAGRFVFHHHDGEPYRNVSSRFRELLKSAQKSAQSERREFRPFRFHDLRHAFAVAWLKNGGSIYDLQVILGHRSIKTTELYLAYLTPEEQARAKQGAAQKSAHVQRFARAGAVEN